MEWRIKHIFNFLKNKPWSHGFCHFGFHGRTGAQYMLHYDENWLGLLAKDDRFLWTAGAVDRELSRCHIPFDVKNPHYITELPDDSLLVSSNGTNKIYRLWPAKKSAELFIDTGLAGLKDIGNCEYDQHGHLWVHEITGCRVWCFNLSGETIEVLGNGQPGFQKETVLFERAKFNWIYDLRLGPDNNIYVLDSRNFCVRRINIQERTVSVVVGTGKPGYARDGGPALKATLGSDPKEHFDGPYSLSIDEDGNIFIGDTCNHVVRMVDSSTSRISTIAGKYKVNKGARIGPHETDPLNLDLPKICSMDYYDRCLFIPEWNDDLVVLEKKQ